MARKKKTTELPEAVAEHFDLIDWKGGHKQVFGRFGTINIKTISLKQAERLEKMDFPKLKRKKKAKATEEN